MLSEENSNASAVCAAVRLDMEGVRDGRATSAERAFVMAHIGSCASCASEWAFAQAAKSAWRQLPTAYPPASLSARIAAATYRKPTFAERFVASFAFLNPMPVRVAVGVVAVAGIAFFALPRHGAMVTQNTVAVPEEKPETVVATAKPAAPKAKPVETARPAPIVAVVKPKAVAVAAPPVIAVKPAPSVPRTVVAAVPVVKTAPKQPVIAAPVVKAIAPKKAAPVLVAKVAQPVRVKPAVVAEAPAPAQESLPTTAQVAPVKTAPMVAVNEKPVAKEPTVTPAAPVAGMTVGERETGGEGFRRLGSQLSNAGRRGSSEILRGTGVVATNNPTYSIVNAPVKY